MFEGDDKGKRETWAYMMALCAAVSLLVDLVVHVLMDMVSVALLGFGITDMLCNPDGWGGLCDRDNDLDHIILSLHWTG